MFVIIGYVVVVVAVLGGYLMAGGHLGVLVQPAEVVIICGGALGAFLISNSPKVVSGVVKALPTLFQGSVYNKTRYMETMILLYDIFTTARREGMLALEQHISEPEKSELFRAAPTVLADHHAVEFITDYLRMISSGNFDPMQIENLMDVDIETHHHEGEEPIHALQRLADGMPAFGIVAAVMGVVHTMESLHLPPAELGGLIGAALVGTFLGILVSYGFIAPLTGLLEQKLSESTKFFQSIKVAIVASLQGYDPTTSVEFARKVLFSTERPKYSEMEKFLKKKKE